MADTISISDKVVIVQARTKTSWRLLTYDTQTLSPNSTISNELRDLSELIFTPFKIHAEKEKYQNNAKPIIVPTFENGERTQKKIL